MNRLDIRINRNKSQKIPDYYDCNLQDFCFLFKSFYFINMKKAKILLIMILTMYLEHIDIVKNLKD